MAAQIKCGSRVTGMGDQFVDKTVAQLRAALGERLEIPPGAPAVVSRDGGVTVHAVQESYRLQHGDLLEFTRPAGQKGFAN